MSIDLEDRLRDAFRDDAARVRLVNPERPAFSDASSLSVARRSTSRRWRAVVAAAAAVALVVATAVTVTRNRDRGTGVTTMPGPTALFPELRPDATTALPLGPITALASPGVVWTGTELIVWGVPSAPDTSPPPEGAAFNPATSTWRTIARAPIRSGSPVAWTGGEMIVWGDRSGDGSAAYDPSTDTWRRLPEAPIAAGDTATAVWTGTEVVVFSDQHNGLDLQAAAYNPETDEWRALAGTTGNFVSDAVWTGTTVLTILDVNTGPSAANDGSLHRLARYDLSTDTWHVDTTAVYTSLVGVPDRDGVTRTVLAVPVEPGKPVDRLDAAGNLASTLPAVPRDPGASTTAARGLWLGHQAVFWVILGAPLLAGHSQAWALDPAAGTWRRLTADVEAVANDVLPAVAVGDLLLASDGPHGVAYRAPT